MEQANNVSSQKSSKERGGGNKNDNHNFLLRLLHGLLWPFKRNLKQFNFNQILNEKIDNWGRIRNFEKVR